MIFDYANESVQEMTKELLLEWIANLHSQLCDTGIITDIDTQTQQEMSIIAKEYHTYMV